MSGSEGATPASTETAGTTAPTRPAVGYFPHELVCDAETMDGSTVHLRPIRPDDGERLVAFHRGLSPDSVYHRFFFAHPQLSDQEIERFTHVDYVDRLALVAEEGGRLIAVGRYERMAGSPEAEVAFIVADEAQHRGIGTLLLDHLAEAAWRAGITTFVAETLADNRSMLDVFTHSGFPVTSSVDFATVNVRFPIEPDDDYRAALAARRVRRPRPA
ncbi:MAG: N-acetyltransferase family protein [Acidimicrobiales bacterium]